MIESRITPLGFYKSGRPIYPICGGAPTDVELAPRRKAREAKEELRKLLESAKAAQRPLSEDEATRARTLKATIESETKAAEEYEAAMRDLAELAKADDPNGDRSAIPDDSRGDTHVKGAERASAWSKAVVARVQKANDRLGMKALVSGSISVPAQVDPAVPLPDVPTRILDLIPRAPLATNNFDYLRQVVRTNNAAPVADLGTKPTSVYTLQEIDDRARVIAHLSEAFPLRYLSDYPELAALLDSQMVAGIYEELEAQIVSGDGVGENMRGILNTTGTVAVPFATSEIATIRHARTVMENAGEQPTAWVLNPTDAETLDLLRDDSGAAAGTGGFLLNSAALDTIFGANIPRISSPAVPAGSAILADWRLAELKVREDASTLAATQAGDLWETNGVILRSEGRFGIKFGRPSAFAVVDLAA